MVKFDKSKASFDQSRKHVVSSCLRILFVDAVDSSDQMIGWKLPSRPVDGS